jgi:hypothetical protein
MTARKILTVAGTLLLVIGLAVGAALGVYLANAPS